MARINLNIQKFGEDMEQALDPSAFNSMINNYESELPVIDRAFSTNKEALITLKAVAGSPTISEETRGTIQGLTNAIDETANYFDSVRGWANEVVSAVHSLIGSVGLQNTSKSINREILDEIQERFEGGYTGIRSAADVDEFIEAIQSSVIPTLRDGLLSITDSVASAAGSLPQQVHVTLQNTINTTNDQIAEGYNNAITFLTEQVDFFKEELMNFVENASAAASGGE
ncbi:MAG: hypothetical protein IKF82_04045 [Bacilli bacterium]|nr:hypothetical protein [Bacilli bacterium]